MAELDIIDDGLATDGEAVAAGPKPSILDVIRNRDFRLLWLGEGISLLGDQFYLVALPWLTLQLSDGSGVAVVSLLGAALLARRS